MAAGAPLLSVENVSKTYDNGTVALKGVSLDVYPGTVHGLMGENGAGKSTLLKVIAGVHRPSAGTVRWKGEPVSFATPLDAVKAGIGTVHQHIPLAPTLSVLENVFLGHPGWRRRDQALERHYEEIARKIGYFVDAHTLVGALSIGERQMISIMHALAADAALVILDEPTASLSETERERLFEAIRQLASTGTAFLFCSHFIREVMKTSSEITVVRDGRIVLHAATDAVSTDTVFEKIAGRELAEAEQERQAPPPTSETVLEADGLRVHPGTAPLDLRIARGEVVGIAGLMGSGRSSLLRTLYGARKPAGGQVRLANGRVASSIAKARAGGVAFLPEDRVADALVLDWEIWRNLSLPVVADVSWKRSVLRTGEERRLAQRLRDRLSVKAASVDMRVSELSGGNAQKVAIGRTISPGLSVLLLDEPSVGVDVGAKAEILRMITDLATESRVGIVVVSSAFEELIAVANRLLVMRDATIVAERVASETSERELLALASGIESHSPGRAE